MLMKISVLLPVYNAEINQFKLAVSSISNQTEKEFEVVIVDDGCKEEIKEFLEKLMRLDSRFRVYSNSSNKGLVYSLNKGLELCNGTWIARMDADDISHPERLKTQIDFLHKHPDTTVLGTYSRYIENNKCVPYTRCPFRHDDILSALAFTCPFVHPSVMFKKSDIIQIGGYPDVKNAEDFALWTKLMFDYDRVQFRNIPKDLLWYRKGNFRLNYKAIQEANHMKILCLNSVALDVQVPICWEKIRCDIDDIPIAIEQLDNYAKAFSLRFPKCDSRSLEKYLIREQIRMVKPFATKNIKMLTEFAKLKSKYIKLSI